MKKRQQSGRGQSNVIEFERVDVNDICYASDDELYQLSHELTSARERGRDLDTRDVEIEICYVQREKKIRAARREAHELYVQNLQNENAALGNAMALSLSPTEVAN